MLLSVDNLSTQVETIRSDIEKLRTQIIADKGEEEAVKIFSQQREPLNRLREQVAIKKASKLERDANDYLQNRVYTWREDRYQQREDRSYLREDRGRQREYRGRGTYRKAEGQYWQRTRGSSRTGLPAPHGHSHQNYRSTPNAAHMESYASSSSDDYSPSTSSQPFLDVDPREKGYPPKRSYKNPRAPIPREQYPQRLHSKPRF
ncbi:uncharacterized protein LOC121402098 [Xenopus laevis]|uniref:Uncharacterized protein LOC121393797 n=1 Tax=Xenopus laevis TaxID=8355 RepID=A0A8J1MR40_XENLA|nr:uncharacterized protein LOC121393797 [Xenopus laevis]XP_041443906.1 uncharacterized protein LOC121402098 [Xenopus laevis]